MWIVTGEGEYTRVILALGKRRPKDQEFEASPRHIKLSQNNKTIATICRLCVWVVSTLTNSNSDLLGEFLA